MEVVGYVFYGLQVALQPENLLYCFVGVSLGTLVGVLPGIGPIATMSLMLPISFHTSPVSALIMLAGIYYGAQYGGTITSVLANIPGEASTVMTCLDGYQMARKGKAGLALGVSAIGSFIAGSLSILGLIFLAQPLAKRALSFGPPEYFSLICMALVILISLAQGSLYRSAIMALLGLLIGLVGLDPIMARPRFTFGLVDLMDGVAIVPLIMGIFGIAEILINLERTLKQDIYDAEIAGVYASLREWTVAKWAILRGTVIGFLLGILPGGGAVISSFIAYGVEKRLSKYPEKYGTGVIEGVAAPEAANNAAAQSCLIPLLSLGLPPNVVMAILYGGLMIHGIQPGPLLIQDHPDIFWGLAMSMYVGNVVLLVLNLPLVGLWVKLLKVPYPILFPLMLFFCIIGVYSVNNSVFDIYLMILFGLIGYLMKKFDFEPAPLAMAYVLSPIFESSFRQSLNISGGSISIFFSRPISLACIIMALAIMSFQIGSFYLSRHKAWVYKQKQT